MKTVEQELAEIRALPNPWDTIFSHRERFSVRAVAVFACISCIASDFKRELERVDDRDLDLLAEHSASSAMKTKALAIRLRRRSKTSPLPVPCSK